MPINIPNNLPAREILQSENVFVMSEEQAVAQDIRPLEVLVLNLMPKKIETENQLARVLGNTSLQVNLSFLVTESYTPKNVSEKHLGTFYRTFTEIKHKKYDGLIVTGAPVEKMEWEDVAYWQELQNIFEWSRTNVWTSFFLCWGAQAALKHFHNLDKVVLEKKKFGVYLHNNKVRHHPLLRGFDDEFYVPVSRHTETLKKDVEAIPALSILSESDKAGLYIVENQENRQLFVFNHPEYEATTLKDEYQRDINQDKDIHVPYNYFPNDDVNGFPRQMWRAHAYLLYSNWLNYYVYQSTPFTFHKEL